MPSVAAAYVANSGGTAVTSGNFNVVANDLIVVIGHSDQLNTPAMTWAIADNQTPDLAYTEIARRDYAEAGSSNFGAVIAWYHKVVDAITGLNITLTVSGGSTPDSPAIKVLKFPAGEYDPADIVGAITEGNLTTDPQTSASITPETSGTGVAVWTDFNQTGTPTSSDLTATGFNTAGNISGASGYKTLSAGVGATANMNSGGTPQGNYLWFEIRAAAGGGGIAARAQAHYRRRRAA